jgi:hypothetical protein
MLLKHIVELSIDEFESVCWKQFYTEKFPCWEFIGNVQFDVPTVNFETNPFDYNVNIQTEQSDGNSAYMLSRAYFNEEDSLYQTIKNYLEVDYMSLTINQQEPGWLTPVHFDRNRTLCQTKVPSSLYQELPINSMQKYVIFLEDQVLGQNFQIGDEHLSWKAGDIFKWQWFAPHCTSNSSQVNRTLLTIPSITTKPL